MLKTLGSIIMIMGGIIFIFFSFYDNYKKIVKIGTKKIIKQINISNIKCY